MEKKPMSREEHKLLAKFAEQAERFQEMAENMKKVVACDEPLNEEERNLLSVAFKNEVGSRRNAWRVINAQVGEAKSDRHKAICEEMKGDIEKEVNSVCREILKLLDDTLINKAENDQAKVFFLKMKGDYYRYMVEICQPGKQKELVDSSNEAYLKANELAKETLGPTSPIRLGLALNYSVFFYEVMQDPTAACKMAKDAFESAIAELESNSDMSNDVYKDSTLILQLLRDNLTLWKAEMEDNEDD